MNVINTNTLCSCVCVSAPNHCDNNPCLHGTCTPVGRGFMCSCQQGWTGTTCNACKNRNCITRNIDNNKKTTLKQRKLLLIYILANIDSGKKCLN